MSGMKGHVPLVTKLLLFVPEADLRRFSSHLSVSSALSVVARRFERAVL